MNPTEARTADGARRDLHRYVDRHGVVEAERAREQLDLDVERFHDVLSTLERERTVVEQDGALRLAIDAGDETVVTESGLEFTVRPAGEEDRSGIAKVARHIAHEDGYVVGDRVATQLGYENAVIRHGGPTSRVFFVATDEGTIVGWTHLETTAPAATHHTARQTVGVLAPYRGYGIGSALLDRGLEWADDNGYLKVYNSLAATNADALRFLENHGWETEAIRRNHFEIDDRLVDEVMMAAYLDDPDRWG